ncbi:MAG: hypothetical protein WA705_22965 [Candidatus Ozemobacteraceae bacterium]
MEGETEFDVDPEVDEEEEGEVDGDVDAPEAPAPPDPAGEIGVVEGLEASPPEFGAGVGVAAAELGLLLVESDVSRFCASM